MSWRTLALAVFFAAGVVTSDLASPSWLPALLAGVAGAAALTAAWVSIRRRGEPPSGELLGRVSNTAAALLMLGTFAVGFSDLGLRSAALDQALAPRFNGRAVRIEGTLASDPERSGRATGFRLKARSIEETRARERIYVRLFGRVPDLALGDSMVVEGKIRSLDPSNSFDQSLRRRKITGLLTASAGSVGRRSSTKNPILVLAGHLRTRLEQVAKKSMNDADAGLLLGLVIGDERLIPEKIVDDFRATSLSHLTAVSGANVAMVLAAVVLVMRAFKVSKRAQITCGIATVLFFAVITRWEPSVLRATMMSVVGLSAFWFGRRSDPMGGLLITFLALTAFDPFLLWSIGFQLSFAAAAGIILFSPIFLERFEAWPKLVREALSVGLGAQIAVTPLLAFHFGRLSLVSIPANLVAFPLVAPITVLGMAAGLVGSVFVAAAQPIAVLAGIFVAMLRAVASLFASLPFASVAVPQIRAVHLILLYVVVVAAMLWLAGHSRIGRRVVVLAAAFLMFAVLIPPASSEPPDGLRITFFDVGQGDAILVESPREARVLIDGGPDGRVLASHLRRRGIRRIDLLVVSHFHYDHAAGLEGAFDVAEVRQAIHPGVPDPLMNRMSYRERLRESSAGDRFTIGELHLQVLSPDPALLQEATLAAMEAGGEGSALNDASLVIRVSWGGTCALFTGDIEETGQLHLIDKQRQAIDCTIMKAPHHGSARLDKSFVDAVDPEFVPISVGRNDYGHPTLTAIRMFNEQRARVLRTDREGDLVLTVDESGKVSLR